MAISAKHRRAFARWVHVLAGSALGAAVYGPAEWAAALRGPLQVALFPLVAATGLWMWQGHRLRRRRAATPAAKEGV